MYVIRSYKTGQYVASILGGVRETKNPHEALLYRKKETVAYVMAKNNITNSKAERYGGD